MLRRVLLVLLLAGLALGGGGILRAGGAPDDASDASAGAFTVRRFDAAAYLQPVPGLDRRELAAFNRGRRHFDKTWGAVTSLDFEWGLGPTFVAKSCVECHASGGRGRPPGWSGAQLLSMIVRVSLPGEDAHGGPLPDPNYGDQLQNRSLSGPFPDFAYHTAPVPAEAELYLDWDERTEVLGDGESVTLRVPRLRIESLAFGPLGEGAMTSLRIAQPLQGMGLLEAVPEALLLQIAQRQRGQGVNGRPNYVRDDVNDRTTLGRFGWKANQPSLRQQIAAAALGDMGLTTRLYREQNCPPVQRICAMQTPGNDPELVITDWDELELWTRALAVPAQRNVGGAQVRRGAQLFEAAQCSVCHVPTLHTADAFPGFPRAAQQVIHPYTDLLLHDMGEGLADGRPDFKAGPRDWRTPPLWGLGLSETVNGSTVLLHDGRARTLTEAILWHGGEAQAAREAFRAMSKPDREALVRFVNSI
jgi:CxxC motif-containing protein (DUF1111 family)